MQALSRCLRLLKTSAPTNKITDPNQIDKSYRYWRLRIFYSMYIGYAMFYLTRKNLDFIMPSLIHDLHISKIELGILGSAFYIIYGISKFISGMLSDKSNPRYFMAVGLIATGVANIFFGLSTSLWMLVFFWIINGFFQGWGWPPCARLLTHWYSIRERGCWWGLWNTSHNVGGGLIPIIAAVLATYWGWRSAMLVPGIIAILLGLWLINRLRDIPETEGLPPIEEHKKDYPDGHKPEKENVSTKDILIKYVLKNRYIWILAISYVLIYVVRTAVNDWTALFLSERGNSMIRSGTIVSFFEVGGFFGSLVAGWASDKIFAGRRGPINVLFSAGIILSLVAFWFSPHNSFVINAACLFAIGFLVFGPQMLIGVAAAELSHRQAAGTSTGFVGLFAYLGAALSGLPVSYVIQNIGWGGFFVTLGICSLVTVLLLVTLWSAKRYTSPNNLSAST